MDDETRKLDRRRFTLEVIGVIALILSVGGLVFAALGLFSARDAVDTSNRQLREAKYESVYQHQLDLWRFAAEHPDLAPYIVGGRPPERPVDAEGLSPQEPATAEEQKQAGIEAALSQALDFYAYVFSQLAPRDDQGDPPSDVLTASEDDEPPPGIDPDDWAGWPSWATTIVQGFDGAPGMCAHLNEQQGGNYAYEEAFRMAVGDAVPDCVE